MMLRLPGTASASLNGAKGSSGEAAADSPLARYVNSSMPALASCGSW